MKLDERMKLYEHVWRQKLIRRMPVIVSLDGKAFHTFTKGLHKPFDSILTSCMQETALYLAKNIQGCKLAYTQSDEISLLLIDYDNYDTEAWFDNNIQKIVSVAASMASAYFNRAFIQKASFFIQTPKVYIDDDNDDDDLYKGVLKNKIQHITAFDARAFNLDKDEVCNYFIWRQEDCIKNAINMIAREYFSDTFLHNMSTIERKANLEEKGVFMNEYAHYNGFGTAIIYDDKEWKMDLEIPIFKEDRNYIDRFVFLEEKENE